MYGFGYVNPYIVGDAAAVRCFAVRRDSDTAALRVDQVAETVLPGKRHTVISIFTLLVR